MRHIQWHGTTIELGANWIHGTVNNPIYDLARECELKGNLSTNSFVIRNESGDRVTPKARLDALEQAQERADDIVAVRAEMGLADISMEEALKQAGWTASTPEDMAIEYWVLDYTEATPPAEVYGGVNTNYGGSKSATADCANIDTENDKQQYFVADPRGFVYLTERLASYFLTDGDPRLKLDKRVVTVETAEDDGVRVTTATGEVYRADYALVTFSLGVLRSGLVSFQPPLPIWKQKVISKFKMVVYTKIFLKFPHQFWDCEEYILYASKQRGYYTLWRNLEAESSPLRGSNILLATVTASESLRLEKQCNASTQKELMAVLRQMYGQDIPEPIDVFCTHWGSDDWFFGSWAHAPVGVRSADFADLLSPVGSLFFAGEATNEMYHGTVHGAYLSGFNVAERIVTVMRNSGDKADRREKNVTEGKQGD